MQKQQRVRTTIPGRFYDRCGDELTQLPDSQCKHILLAYVQIMWDQGFKDFGTIYYHLVLPFINAEDLKKKKVKG